MISHIFGLLQNPQQEWLKIAAESDRRIKRSFIYFIFMAMLPAIGVFIGITQTGWVIGGGDPVRITVASAIPLSVLFYGALLGGVIFIGWMVHWMASTYNADSFPIKSCVMMGYACSPIFLAGVLAAYPIWWVDLFLAIGACSYAIRLIYLGLPSMMKVPEEQGFLYASAVFMVALVYVVVVLVATAILWEFVTFPVFTN